VLSQITYSSTARTTGIYTGTLTITTAQFVENAPLHLPVSLYVFDEIYPVYLPAVLHVSNE
jgi:hypothetical protein